MRDHNELAQRYVAVWNEPDQDARRTAVRELWAEDGAHVLRPPEEVVGRARGLGLAATFEAHGHEQLELRVRLAYEEFVAPGEFTFRGHDDATRLRDVVLFSWTMVSTRDGAVAGAGTEVLVLGTDGRIRADYQFIRG